VKEFVMVCQLCASSNQAEFSAEINIHFSGFKNLDKPAVLVFLKLLVCLKCGFSRFTVPKTALALLSAGTERTEDSTRDRSAGLDSFGHRNKQM
jgi:hypothetical protein